MSQPYRTLIRCCIALGLLMTLNAPIQAAEAIALKQISALNGLQFIENRRSVDQNNTLHLHVQQTYAGYPIFNAHAVLHLPQQGNNKASFKQLLASLPAGATANGNVYHQLTQDLGAPNPLLLSNAALEKASKDVINVFQHTVGVRPNLAIAERNIMVWINPEDQKAHWIYHIVLTADAVLTNETPYRMVYLIDAENGKVLKEWNNIQTSLDAVEVGGYGGNIKMGKVIYDNTTANLPNLNMTRDANLNLCYLQNSDVMVRQSIGRTVMTFACQEASENHPGLYWDADFDAVNDGFSPGNDALFGGMIIKNMYQDWYHVPALVNFDGSPMLMRMIVHRKNYDNAYWDGREMTFGDGYTLFYPLTSLGIASHEISHGFTEQHSGLYYYDQSGGINEAFSDMAAQAAEYYVYGKNNWQIAPEIFKAPDEALRYMDQPSKDCHGNQPGVACSIDDATQYHAGLNVHNSSGVFNHFFYLLANTEGWDTRKAFDLMVAANQHYWTPETNFSQGACGVIKAAKALEMNIAAVKTDFDQVKVDLSDC